MTNLELTIKLDEFKPRDYQKPLFDAFINKGYKKLMCIWPRRCLHGDTHITLSDGSFKFLKDIKAGDSILSWNGSGFEPDIVINVWKTEPKETVQVKGWNLPVLICSKDHRFATVFLNRDRVRWREAQTLGYRPIFTSEARIPLVLCHNAPNSRSKMVHGCYRTRVRVSDYKPSELYDIETEKNHNFIANGYVVHNSGKDLAALQLLLHSALNRVGIYYMFYPTYNQAKKIIWDGMTNDSKKFLDYIPKELIEKSNETEMKIILKNGSLIQLVGSSDAGDRVVGSNPVGCIFSEFALCDPNCYWLCRPMLNANDGWAIILSTPRGHNSLFQLYEVARQTPEWFLSHLTLDDTKHVSREKIEYEVQTGEMSRDLSLQEYWTSFSVGQAGSFYGSILDVMRLKGQVSIVPFEPGHLVSTFWDIGLDTTAVGFVQCIGSTIHIIDYYQNDNLSLDHYINVIKNKPYSYNKHIAPHDMANREFSSGVSRLEMASRLGVRFTLAPNLSIMDGIEAVKRMLTKTWIDEANCRQLVQCIEHYRQKYDEKKQMYTGVPEHDKYSHGADSLRMLAISMPKLVTTSSPEELEKRYRETVLGVNASLPPIFRNDLPEY
jgi:hypothetical protein